MKLSPFPLKAAPMKAVLVAAAIALPTSLYAQSATTTTPRVTTPSPTIKPFSLGGSTQRNRGVSVTVSWQIELPYKKDDVDDQLETVKKGRRAFYDAIKRECDILKETLADKCTLATMRVSNSTRKIRSAASTQYISGSATFRLELKAD